MAESAPAPIVDEVNETSSLSAAERKTRAMRNHANVTFLYEVSDQSINSQFCLFSPFK